MRHDLSNFLHTGETVVYSSDEAPGTKSSSARSTETALFLFLGSFFIIALIATFAFGIAHGESFAYVSNRSIISVLWLVGILVFIALSHKKITKALKLTSVVITDERLFMAPPADYMKNVGWEGPKAVADIVFTEQLSAIKGQLFASPCLVFTSINPVYQKIASERLPLNKRYIPCTNIDEAFDSLPSFLKLPELKFDESSVEASTPVHDRAVRFLRDRRAKLGHN